MQIAVAISSPSYETILLGIYKYELLTQMLVRICILLIKLDLPFSESCVAITIILIFDPSFSDGGNSSDVSQFILKT